MAQETERAALRNAHAARDAAKASVAELEAALERARVLVDESEAAVAERSRAENSYAARLTRWLKEGRGERPEPDTEAITQESADVPLRAAKAAHIALQEQLGRAQRSVLSAEHGVEGAIAAVLRAIGAELTAELERTNAEQRAQAVRLRALLGLWIPQRNVDGNAKVIGPQNLQLGNARMFEALENPEPQLVGFKNVPVEQASVAWRRVFEELRENADAELIVRPPAETVATAAA